MSEENALLVGSWKGQDKDVLITFQKNGNMNINSEDIEIPGTYTACSNEIIIKINLIGINQILKIKYKFINDDKICFEIDEEEELFIRDLSS